MKYSLSFRLPGFLDVSLSLVAVSLYYLVIMEILFYARLTHTQQLGGLQRLEVVVMTLCKLWLLLLNLSFKSLFLRYALN